MVKINKKRLALQLPTAIISGLLMAGAAQAQGTYVQAAVVAIPSHGGNSTSDTQGIYYNGHAADLNFGSDTNFSLALGYQFSDLVRADLSYSQMKSSIAWHGAFLVGRESDFHGKAESRLLMANLHLHGKGIRPDIFTTIDPFITIGVGIGRNALSSIEEIRSNGTLIASIADGTRNQAVYKLGVGADYAVTPHLTLTSSVDMLYPSSFQSGSTRRKDNGTVEPLEPWAMNTAPRLNLAVGLRYSF